MSKQPQKDRSKWGKSRGYIVEDPGDHGRLGHAFLRLGVQIPEGVAAKLVVDLVNTQNDATRKRIGALRAMKERPADAELYTRGKNHPFHLLVMRFRNTATIQNRMHEARRVNAHARKFRWVMA